MTSTWGIEMFTLEQDEELLDLLRWRKELLLAGYRAHEYCLTLDDEHAEMLGSPSQVVGITIQDDTGWKRTVFMSNGQWRVLTPGIQYGVTFERGLEKLKEHAKIP